MFFSSSLFCFVCSMVKHVAEPTPMPTPAPTPATPSPTPDPALNGACREGMVAGDTLTLTGQPNPYCVCTESGALVCAADENACELLTQADACDDNDDCCWRSTVFGSYCLEMSNALCQQPPNVGNTDNNGVTTAANAESFPKEVIAGAASLLLSASAVFFVAAAAL